MPSIPPSTTSRQDPTGLTDDEPPAYTPSPDAAHGEATIEQGPARPFQPPPQQHHPTQFLSPQSQPSQPNHYHPPQWPRPNAGATTPLQSLPLSSVLRQLVSQLTGPAQAPPQSYGHGSSWAAYPGSLLNAHNNGSVAQMRPSPPPLPPRRPSSSPASEFARDFYAAGPSPPESAPALSQPNAQPVPASPAHPPPSAGHARPTERPTPGHPLLRDGKLLVYPRGFECPKCHNLGYKHADPSHPCNKCWTKFAKRFAGPLVYAYANHDPGSTPLQSAGAGSTSFQRPLPNFAPARPRITQPPPPPPPPPQPAFPPPPQRHLRSFSPYSPPPPGSVVYPAGDPRIGGHKCWRCDGRGSISVLFIDTVTCDACGGIGRVF